MVQVKKGAHIAQTGGPAPLTDEEKKAQIERFLTQKRESIAAGVLFNLCQGVDVDIMRLASKDLAHFAVEVADAFIEELYPVAGEDGSAIE